MVVEELVVKFPRPIFRIHRTGGDIELRVAPLAFKVLII
jgi:hypothetical protein